NHHRQLSAGSFPESTNHNSLRLTRPVARKLCEGRELRVSVAPGAAILLDRPLSSSTKMETPCMKRTPLWISAAFVVLLLTSTLFWNFSMRAASRPGPGKKGQAAANNQAIENFDIRDRESQEAMLKFERRMEKLSSMRKEKSANLKLAMWGAKKRKAESVEGLEVTFRDLTNSPEIIEVSGRGRKFLTPP